MRTRLPRDARRRALVGALAVMALGLVVAGPISGAGSEDREAAERWRAAFPLRPDADVGQRMIVLLAAPSLADRVASAKTPLGARAQRRVVEEADRLQRRLLAALRTRGVAVGREHVFTRTVNGFSAALSPRAVAALEAMPGVLGVYPVRTVYPAAGTLAPAAFGDLEPSSVLPGVDGGGVTIALLDTGIDRSTLSGHVQRGVDLFSGDGNAATDPKPDDPLAFEAHGTRMAQIVTGIAPGATLLPLRVLGWTRAADGLYYELGRSDLVLAGLERAVDPDGDGAVEDAARIALAAFVEPYAAFADSPESRAVAGALELGTLVVAAAGNDGPAGPGFGTVGAPGGAPAALTVGAADLRAQLGPFLGLQNPDASRVAAFSSRGPAFDGRVKPDVVAAGVGVPVGRPGDGSVGSVTGTSAAAAGAAGTAALVASARPDLDAVSLRGVLVGSAKPLAEPTSVQGAGVLDAQAARDAEVAVEPASVVVGDRIRVRNLSARTLRVTVSGAPRGLAVSPRLLTLPPRMVGEVELEAAGALSANAGVLLLRAGTQTTRVPWAALQNDPGVKLVTDVRLARPRARAVLSFQAGSASEGAEGLSVQPVGLLEVELWTRDGQRLGILARLRDLLPGRYAIELTGRDPDGRPLARGAYVVRLRAHAVGLREGQPGRVGVASVHYAIGGPTR